MTMRRFFSALLLGSFFLTGCAHYYVVVLNTRQHFIAPEKPHLEGFNFVFTDLDGRTNSIPSEYVRAVVRIDGELTNKPSK